jgi:hypothetical protein
MKTVIENMNTRTVENEHDPLSEGIAGEELLDIL